MNETQDLSDVQENCFMILGLALSLAVGMEYGKKLSRLSKKPFIPIHHMEAHALTIRMVEKVNTSESMRIIICYFIPLQNMVYDQVPTNESILC